MKKFFPLLGLGLCLGHAYAQDRPHVSEGNVPQGEVHIQGDGTLEKLRKEGAVIEVYRQGGVVYKVKVTPKKGRPYYLVDSDGNGSLDLVQWVLYSW